MAKIISKLVSMGFDFSTRKALAKALKIIGVKPDNLDRLYVEVKNSANIEAFRKIPAKDKAVFLPQCLRNAKKCRAPLEERGYRCLNCGSCKIAEIKKALKKKGCKIYIAPGGTMVYKIVRETKPKAALGVACLKELTMAMENLPIPTMGVVLLRDGCINTDVEVKRVIAAFNGNGVSGA